MKVINAQGVNDALRKGVKLFSLRAGFREQDSRNGPTLEAIGPVVTVYQRPWERVLLYPSRDANPFFHLVEAIWMMAGSNDLKQLTYFNSGMSKFSDDGETLNGAYGYRWFQHFDRLGAIDRPEYDQVEKVIEVLQKDPESRRAVLQMWDARSDLDSSSKDIPCNTNIYFKIRNQKLQMTVCNRSNDMIWGAYGANAVHMSVLQEYVAKALNVEMGEYYQFSDSFHVYLTPQWSELMNSNLDPIDYPQQQVPVVTDASTFIEECKHFIAHRPTFDWGHLNRPYQYTNPIFTEVLYPMVMAYACHKDREYALAHNCVQEIKAADWQKACDVWIRKRQINYEIRNAK